MADPNPEPNRAEPFVPVRQVTTTTTLGGPAAATSPLYAPGGPQPSGTQPEAVADLAQGVDSSPKKGEGIDGEEVVWEASYSMRNFLGRIAVRVLLTIAWIALAIETWGNHHEDWAFASIALGIVLVALWVILLFRMAQARYGHYYRLTNRRLFVSTGLMKRRRDQMELLRVKDVYTRQRLVERWVSLGTVIVVSSEKELPIFYLTGVADPKQVMDLIWHHARAERDNRSTKIDSV
ncbi:MAG: hypothetical protein NVSMB9_34000 [Isosphaeraceae bacterium]